MTIRPRPILRHPAHPWGGLSVDKIFEGKVWPLLACAAQALGVWQIHSDALLDAGPLRKTVTLFAMGQRDPDALMVGGKLPWKT